MILFAMASFVAWGSLSHLPVAALIWTEVLSVPMTAGKNWIIVRNSKKGYGTGKMVEGLLKTGDVVLLVEDIATTGGQVLEAAKIITDTGAKLKKIVCVIDRKQGADGNSAQIRRC